MGRFHGTIAGAEEIERDREGLMNNEWHSTVNDFRCVALVFKG